jgi:large subunit ribosomal protein L17
MKHVKKGRKFSREKKQRVAMLKTMLGSFLLKEKITTTEAKAKELKMISDKFLGSAVKAISQKDKKDELASMRVLSAQLPRNIKIDQIKKIAEKFAAKKSGFTRIIKKGARRSDSAKMAIIEMIKA